MDLGWDTAAFDRHCASVFNALLAPRHPELPALGLFDSPSVASHAAAELVDGMVSGDDPMSVVISLPEQASAVDAAAPKSLSHSSTALKSEHERPVLHPLQNATSQPERAPPKDAPHGQGGATESGFCLGMPVEKPLLVSSPSRAPPALKQLLRSGTAIIAISGLDGELSVPAKSAPDNGTIAAGEECDDRSNVSECPAIVGHRVQFAWVAGVVPLSISLDCDRLTTGCSVPSQGGHQPYEQWMLVQQPYGQHHMLVQQVRAPALINHPMPPWLNDLRHSATTISADTLSLIHI